MPLSSRQVRFAHSDGHSDVCYFTGEKKGLITCGADGDVRAWINVLDDDPASGCIADQVICVLSKDELIYVGHDNNTVQILTHPDFNKAGILTNFSSAVSALATCKNSKLIASGSCDFRIRVTHIDTLNTTELNGHEAPILGLTLDPKEVFVASSSADGSIKVWDIAKKTAIHTFSNVIPKCNSFYTAKVYGTPSFEPISGKYLAFPKEKQIVVVNRESWIEVFRLECSKLKADLNICKFSECGTFLAASSLYGEIVVWRVENRSEIGYVEHPNQSKITSLAWNPEKADEIAFCDAVGHLGSIIVEIPDSETIDSGVKSKSTEALSSKYGYDDNYDLDDVDDDDDENVISISKIKATAERDEKGSVHSEPESKYDAKPVMAEFNLQEPFQPTSTPSHLMSYFMVWNEVGIVTYYESENDDTSSIEVEFHETSTHHSMRINNYLNHTMAALSTEALVLSCPASDDELSKVVVVALQGWGSGNKEWTSELPKDEDSQCIAAGDNFVAVATSRRFLRIFTISGIQRDIIAIPGPVVTMNAYKNYLLVVYHSGVGGFEEQNMQLMWLKFSGRNIRSQTLNVPLSTESKLRWVGFTDTFTPAIYDTDDILKVYNKKIGMWNVMCDMKSLLTGQNDHYFLISITGGNARAVACKGSYYPVTNPRPFALSVSLFPPLCNPDDEKSKIEAKLCQLEQDTVEEESEILALIVAACRNNVEYRVVDICQNLASQKVIELAIKYVARINKQSLVKKLQSIAESKYTHKLEENKKVDEDVEMFEDLSKVEDDKEEEEVKVDLVSAVKKNDFELKPLPFVHPRRSNPFLKTKNSPKISGLEALGKKEISSPKISKDSTATKENIKEKEKAVVKDSTPKKETFAMWYMKVKEELQKEHPELQTAELSKLAWNKYKEKEAQKTNENENQNSEEPESKKRKREEMDDFSESTKSASSKLANFRRNI